MCLSETALIHPHLLNLDILYIFILNQEDPTKLTLHIQI